MRRDLAELLAGIDRAPGREALGDLICAYGRAVLRSHAFGFYVYPNAGGRPVTRIAGLPGDFGGRYERLGRAVDPVLETVQASHATASSNQLMSDRAWQSHPLYQQVCGRFGGDYYMSAPLVGPGGIIGTMHAGRSGPDDEFLRADVSAMSAIALHASVALAGIVDDTGEEAAPGTGHPALPGQRPSPAGRAGVPGVYGLAPREWQISCMVAEGLTNASIGRRLGISEHTVKQTLRGVFRKTGVTCRAELAALVAAP